MADLSVNMGISGLSTFKQGMKDAEGAVKSLDAQLKLNEAQLKLTGDQEQYMANKAGLLQTKLEKQKEVVENAKKALEEMEKNGVSKSSASFQKMQTNVWNATTKLTEIQAELSGVETGTKNVKTGTENMNTELKNVGKGVSWNNISEGLDKITNKLASGARAAVNFGKKIMDSAKDATGWADDLQTRSLQTGFSVEDLQRMDKVAEFIDTDVDAIINARKRMSKAVAGEGREDIAEIFGLNISGKENPEELFWQLGDALVHMEEGFDKEAAAQKVFGRSWNELLPLFKAGREEYEKMLSEQSVLTDEQVKKLGDADDAIRKAEQQIEDLKRQFWAESSETIVSLLEWVVDNKDDVVLALEVIGGAFGAMKIASFAANLGQVVNGFKSLGLIKGGASAASAAGGAAGTAGAAGAGGGLASFLGAVGVPAAVVTAALAPAMIANAQNRQEWANEYSSRVGAASRGGANAEFIARAAEVLGADGRTDFGAADALLMGLASRQNQQKAELRNALSGSVTAGNDTWNLLNRYWAGEAMDMGVVDELLENITDAFAAADAVTVPMEPDLDELQAALDSAGLTAPVTFIGDPDGEHANGLWSVPFDGYHAILHRGERVVPAREAGSSRNFSSNLYVESMYMNNGTDAAGLASAMAAAQRRTMNGFGS